MTRPVSRGRLGTGFRPRLILAFILVAALIAVSGGAGLLFVNRIGATVGIFSDVASPMLAQSTDLVGNAQEIRTVLLEVLSEDGQATQTKTERIAKLEADGQRGLDALRALSLRAGIDLQIDAATKSRAEFTRTVRELIAAHHREQAADALVKQRYALFETERRNIDAALASVVSRAEGRMIEAE